MLSRYAIVGSLLLGFVGSSGCYAGVGGSEDSDAAASGAEGQTDGNDGLGPGEDGLGPVAEQPAPTTRFSRLTHVQWEHTVQDLFELGVPTNLSAEFRADPLVGGFVFDNNALSLEIDQALWAGYQRAAIELAQMVSNDATIIARIAPDVGADEASRARHFIERFGQRAFRRPLTDDEVQIYVELFERGDELDEQSSGFEAGVRLVLEGMLQSPFFLYRVERSEEIVAEVIPLTSWEVASRMSYFLWNSMPDDALFEAARRDELTSPEVVREHAIRMLESNKAVEVVESFHHQLLRVQRFASADPSEAFYPDAPENLGELATLEHDLFMKHAIFDNDSSWIDVLTSTQTFVNDELAKVYGLEGDYGPDFELVELDPAERRGLFTQVGFLAANATGANSDPIHRGVFMAIDLACHNIQAPPDDIPPVPVPDPTQSNRQTVEALTEIPGSDCETCHRPLINPFGFAFEHYDSTGAFRTMDNGTPVDARGRVLLGREVVEVNNALDLVEAMAESIDVHRCYAKHWVEYAMARPHVTADEALLKRLAEESLDNISIKDVLVELTTSRPFLARSMEEMQ